MADGQNSLLTVKTTARRPAEARDAEQVARGLARTMAATVVEHGLVEEGDRILVALSGGKDSYTMLELLERARRRAPVSFSLVAFHLDQGQPGHDVSRLRSWLRDSGVPFEIGVEDTYSVVLETTQRNEERAYCRVCSRLRRGILYSAAERLECNKIALGHHREDALETLLLNLLYAGKLQSMPAVYRTNDDRFQVIRPLIECAESDIARHSEAAGHPILPCNLCGSQGDLKRVAVGELLAELESRIPNVRQVMLAALRNVRPSHLLDRAVADAWAEHADEHPPRR